MAKIGEILKSRLKPKEKVALLSESIKKDKALIKELIECFIAGSDVEKGTCADVMKHVSKDTPEILIPYIDDLIGYVNYTSPRVRWGVPESIGNMSEKFPGEVEKAIPKLLINTEDKSTVVRWCAAFALSEMVKYNFKKQKELVSIIDGIVKREKNNGVKNVYLKALKIINKQAPFG